MPSKKDDEARHQIQDLVARHLGLDPALIPMDVTLLQLGAGSLPLLGLYAALRQEPLDRMPSLAELPRLTVRDLSERMQAFGGDKEGSCTDYGPIHSESDMVAALLDPLSTK